jgi:hypothetical protein
LALQGGLFTDQFQLTCRRLRAERADGLPEVCRAAIIGETAQDSMRITLR